jgi:transcriptional regulator with XRE-family HTH domain
MDIRQQFAANVKRLRKVKNLSQEQLAFETGIHRTYISGVERSIRNPTIVIVDRIANALGVEPMELFRRD